MLIRSRSARFAALALAATTPLIAAYAVPAFADGDDAVVNATINDDGDVVVTSTKGLSRTTVVLCDGSLVVIPSWSGDPTSGVVDVNGEVRAVFIHSGNNTTKQAEDLLKSLAPGAVHGNSTGAIAYDDPCTVADSGGGGEETPGGGEETPGGGEETPGGEETATPVDTSDPAPAKTDVLGVTIENVKASDPAPAPAAAPAPAVAPTAAPAPAPVVDSNTLAGGELPRTGSSVQFLVTLALALVAAGVTLRATFTRRIRSASSPG